MSSEQVQPAPARKAERAAAQLADTLGSMLAFVGGALGGRLGASLLDLDGWGTVSFTLGVAAVTVIGLRQLAGGATDPAADEAAAAAGVHHYRLRSRRIVHGALVVGAAATALGLRSLGQGHFAPALVAGPAVLLACVVMLASRTLQRQIRVTEDGLGLKDGPAGEEQTLPFADIQRALCDTRGALLIDTGNRQRNLLLPSATSGWSTFYVTGLDQLAARLQPALGERFQQIDGVMPALRRLARGEEPLPPAPENGSEP